MILKIKPLRFIYLIQIGSNKFSTNFQSISSCYSLFGLKEGCSNLQLKRSYLDMVRKYHPDLSRQPNAKQKFQQIQKAYDILQEHMKLKQSKKDNEGIKNTKEQRQETTLQEEEAEKFYKKFGQRFERKSYANQSMQFSYNLFKKHYENIGEKKKQYRKYSGNQRQQWYHKSEEEYESMPMWKFVRNCIGIICCIGSILYIGGVR